MSAQEPKPQEPKPFDFGNRNPENYNQFERHKTHPQINTPEQPEFLLPVRVTFVHKARCKKATQAGLGIAETYAIQPTFYGRMFCCACQDYFLLEEFIWWDGSQNLDTAKFGAPGKPGTHGDQYKTSEGATPWQAARDYSKPPPQPEQPQLTHEQAHATFP